MFAMRACASERVCVSSSLTSGSFAISEAIFSATCGNNPRTAYRISTTLGFMLAKVRRSPPFTFVVVVVVVVVVDGVATFGAAVTGAT